MIDARPLKASIVIPAHNEERVITGALTAAVAQQYDNFEIIVVDNASSDRTALVVREFAAGGGFEHLTVVREEKKGILHARECGRRAATGDVIAQMDADCLPEPKWLATGLACFANPAVVAVSGPCDFHDGPLAFRYTALYVQKLLYTLSNLIVQHVLRKGAVCIGGNTMIRASALAQINGYDTTIPFYGEDTDTARRLSKVGRVRFLPRLEMKTSARRFKQMGVARVFCIYLMNFFSVIFRGRPYSGAREPFAGGQTRSNRSAFITLAHAATKSFTNFSCESVQP